MKRDRDELIQRKEEVRAEIAVCTRRLAAEAGQPDGRRAAELQARLEALMAEENRLRQLIDRSRGDKGAKHRRTRPGGIMLADANWSGRSIVFAF